MRVLKFGAICLTVACAIALSVPVASASAAQIAGVDPTSLANDARIPNGAARRSAIAATGDYRIDALVSGYRLPVTASSRTITYSFYSDSVQAGSYYGSEKVSEVSEATKQRARAVMATYSRLLSIDFVETTETTSTWGAIRFMNTDMPSYAYAYYPTGTMSGLSGDVHLQYASRSDFEEGPGDRGYMVILHEVGHAVGLKHPFEGATTLPANQDNDTYTVMTYSDKYEQAASLMPYDVLALDSMYGARATHATQPYVFPTTYQYRFEGGGIQPPSVGRAKYLLNDNGGSADLDLSSLPSVSGGYRIDLRPGGWICESDDYRTSYMIAGTALSHGTNVGDVVLTPADDVVVANDQPNVFSGYASGVACGSDTVTGASSEDSIDLSDFPDLQVQRARSGDDLLLTFPVSVSGTGRIRVVGYYTGAAPTILTSASAKAPTTLTLASPNTPYTGASMTLRGRMSGVGAEVLSGRPVKIERFDGAAWAEVARATTGSDSAYSVIVVCDSAGTYRASWAGDPTHEPAVSASIVVSPEARPSSLSLAFSSVPPGEPARISGTLRGGDGSVWAGRSLEIREYAGATGSDYTVIGHATTQTDGSYSVVVDGAVPANRYRVWWAGDAFLESCLSAEGSPAMLASTHMVLGYHSTPAWGSAAAIDVSVESSDGPASGGVAVLERAVGSGFAEITRCSIDGAGGGRLTFVPRAASSVRVRFVGAGRFGDSSSAVFEIKPHAQVSSVRVGRERKLRYRVTGKVAPGHGAGSRVRIERWLLVRSKWVGYPVLTAPLSAASSASVSSFASRVSFPKAGKWRIRATVTEDAGHAAASSAFVVVSAK